MKRITHLTRQGILGRWAAPTALLLLATSCVSQTELDAAAAHEREAEAIVAELESKSGLTDEERAQLIDARQIEARLEERRKALEALSQRGLVDTGLEALPLAARQDWVGLFGLITALGAAELTRRTRKTAREDLEHLKQEREASREQRLTQERERAHVDAVQVAQAATARLDTQRNHSRELEAIRAQLAALTVQAGPSSSPHPPVRRTPAEHAAIPATWPPVDDDWVAPPGPGGLN